MLLSRAPFRKKKTKKNPEIKDSTSLHVKGNQTGFSEKPAFWFVDFCVTAYKRISTIFQMLFEAKEHINSHHQNSSWNFQIEERCWNSFGFEIMYYSRRWKMLLTNSIWESRILLSTFDNRTGIWCYLMVYEFAKLLLPKT